MLKKFIAIAAAAAMTFGTAEMLPGGVFDTGAVVRSSAETYGDYEYRELEDGTVEITLYVYNYPEQRYQYRRKCIFMV